MCCRRQSVRTHAHTRAQQILFGKTLRHSTIPNLRPPSPLQASTIHDGWGKCQKIWSIVREWNNTSGRWLAWLFLAFFSSSPSQPVRGLKDQWATSKADTPAYSTFRVKCQQWQKRNSQGQIKKFFGLRLRAFVCPWHETSLTWLCVAVRFPAMFWCRHKQHGGDDAMSPKAEWELSA